MPRFRSGRAKNPGFFTGDSALIIVMNPDAAAGGDRPRCREIERMGCQAHLAQGKFRTVIGAVGEEGLIDQNHLASLDGVEKVVPIMKPYKLASREFHEDDTRRRSRRRESVPKVKIGGNHAACIAGPCAVENEKMLNTHRPPSPRRRGDDPARRRLTSRGPAPIRSRATANDALKWMRECGDELGMPICAEVMDTRQVELMEKYTDCFQIGARNMQNFDLLREVGKTRKAGAAEARPGRQRQGLAPLGRICPEPGEPRA